jgi:hypothetical protein
MARIARTKNHRPVEVAAAEDMARGSPDAGQRSVVPTTHAAAFGMVKAGGALAGFWLEQVNEQVALNARTLGKLAAARGWRERLAIQSAFMGDSLSRLREGVSRHADLAGTMVTRPRGTGAGVQAATSNPERHR